MLKILKCELKRAFSSKLFWVALLIGIAIAAVSAGQNLADYYEGLKMEATRAEYMGDNPYNPMNPMTTVYNYWIGGDYEGPMTPLFYLLLPLLVCLPFSWSYLTDRKSGYINQSMVHIRKKSDYFFAKYIAIFLSGGVVVAVPLILNILTIACFIPAYHPDIFYDMYYSMSFHDMRWLFYTNPVVYEIYIILQAFIFAGLFAVTGYVFSFFIRNRFCGDPAALPLYFWGPVSAGRCFVFIFEQPVHFPSGFSPGICPLACGHDGRRLVGSGIAGPHFGSHLA